MGGGIGSGPIPHGYRGLTIVEFGGPVTGGFSIAQVSVPLIPVLFKDQL